MKQKKYFQNKLDAGSYKLKADFLGFTHSPTVGGGFTLVEVIVGIAIFTMVSGALLASFVILSRSSQAVRRQTILNSLVAGEAEIVRNLPYSEVGTLSGIPSGQLPDFASPKLLSIEGTQFQVYYEVTYIDDPADGTIVLGTDTAPNDYKQVKMFVKNTVTNQLTTVLTTVSPQGLEGLENAGALLVRVLNASGVPVDGATVTIQNTLLDPDVNLNRTSDSAGSVLEVGSPASVNGYHITATKSGYTTDQTYPISQSNPSPIRPDATVVSGQVTEVTLTIDLVSQLTIKTVNTVCQPVSGVGVNVRGTKLIGLVPDVLKFNQNYTTSGGQSVIGDLEWDTYIPTLLEGQSYVVRGTSPIQQIVINPNTQAVYTIVLDTNSTANSLLVIVKDAATGTALAGASVHLQKGGSQPQDYYGTTSGSVWIQSDWTDGSGQADFVDDDRYYADDSNVDINSVPTGVRLKKTSGSYALSGWLESSTFDTGTDDSNFSSLTWEPTSQDAGTTLKFQLATSSSSSGPWNYKGPDGTASTYYTSSGQDIASTHDGGRYVRYKALLATTNDKKTPILTSLHVNYVSGCATPGQWWFGDLTSGNNYDLDISLSGYQSLELESLDIQDNQMLEVEMSPN